MRNLNFKTWLEDDSTDQNQNIDPTLNNPLLKQAATTATTAMQTAIQKKQNPLQAAQKAVLQAKVPMNQLGKVMPKDPDQKDAT